jgi:hypothetical protein
MYVHKHCPAQGSRRDDGKSDGIYLSGTISASFNADGRRFFAHIEPDNGYISDAYCLDCEAVLINYVEPEPLLNVEEFLARGDFDTKIGWLE